MLDSIKQKIESLKTRIAEAAKSYWDFGFSMIPDEEYDRLVEELKSLTDFEDPVRGPKVLSSGKVVHPVPMLSMQKVYEVDKIVSWIQRYARNKEIMVMPKYDGIALVRYADGTIATRGDGKIGENVTELAAPLFKDKDFVGYGECVCSLHEFFWMEQYGYKNPRNAVSGIMGSSDPEIQARVRQLHFAPYTGIVQYLNTCCPPDILKGYVEESVKIIRHLARIYPLDGIVFRIKDEELFQKLGHTDHHWRGQIALKFTNESATSTIRGIAWNEKNGTITPVAYVDPVDIGGATISKVTLHNAKRVRDWNICIGDECVIERAGGVIPKIVQTKRYSPIRETVYIPTTCPTCGNRLNEVGARLYCPECDK